MFSDCVIVKMEKLPQIKANGKANERVHTRLADTQIDRCRFTQQRFRIQFKSLAVRYNL